MTGRNEKIVVTVKVELVPIANADDATEYFWIEQADRMIDQALRSFHNEQAFKTTVLARSAIMSYPVAAPINHDGTVTRSGD